MMALTNPGSWRTRSPSSHARSEPATQSEVKTGVRSHLVQPIQFGIHLVRRTRNTSVLHFQHGHQHRQQLDPPHLESRRLHREIVQLPRGSDIAVNTARVTRLALRALLPTPENETTGAD